VAHDEAETASGAVLLVVAFTSGMASLACEVLWFRYLAFFLFLGKPAYVFSLILGVYLLGLGVGGLAYSAIAPRVRRSLRALAIVEAALAVAVLGTFALGALLFAGGPPAPVGVAGMAVITVFLPTVLMGMAFPLLCHLYGSVGRQQGRRVGVVLAVNSVGTVVGAVLPVFVLVPWLGIQRSVLFVALLFAAMAALLVLGERKRTGTGTGWWLIGVAGAAAVLFLTAVPANLCQRVFLALGFDLARHTDILFYREGRTGTAIVTRDRVNDRKLVYINGNPEVPALYAHELCFKMLGDLGPLLHPKPDDVLMVCFGGGIAAGATTQLPSVKSLTIVDLEASVVEAAQLLGKENHDVLDNPKTRVVIDDGRNYVMTSPRKWPVIITDSTHPKAPDSWVLYSQEFYRQVRDHLTADGVFVQWVPPHDLSTDEYKIIVRTFQSVFPHTSLWMNAGMDERGQFILYTLLVATPQPLSIDVPQLRERLAAAPVRADLEPYGLASVPGMLDNFVSADDTLRKWVGDGPVNTDDLPYTYFSTRFAKHARIVNAAFLEPMDDIWPRLVAPGTPAEADRLRRELAIRMQANRLLLSGHLAEAYALFPDDPRFQQMRRLLDEGPRYSEALAKVFWDDPNGLNYVAGLGAPGRGAFDAAQRVYERILQLDPDNFTALNMLGCMRSDLGDAAGARDLFDRALRLNPKSALAHYNYGTFLLKQGAVDDAVAHFLRALRTDSDYAEVHANLGTICLQRGELDEAIAHYQRALRSNPDSVDANYNLALALRRTGRVREAIDRYEAALALRPDDPEILNELAWILATSPRPEIRRGSRAVELAERANQLTGEKFPPVLRTLAAAYAEVGRFREAAASAQQGLAMAQGAGRFDFIDQVRREVALYDTGAPLREETK
jgi:spermidine synthase